MLMACCNPGEPRVSACGRKSARRLWGAMPAGYPITKFDVMRMRMQWRRCRIAARISAPCLGAMGGGRGQRIHSTQGRHSHEPTRIHAGHHRPHWRGRDDAARQRRGRPGGASRRPDDRRPGPEHQDADVQGAQGCRRHPLPHLRTGVPLSLRREAELHATRGHARDVPRAAPEDRHRARSDRQPDGARHRQPARDRRDRAKQWQLPGSRQRQRQDDRPRARRPRPGRDQGVPLHLHRTPQGEARHDGLRSDHAADQTPRLARRPVPAGGGARRVQPGCVRCRSTTCSTTWGW